MKKILSILISAALLAALLIVPAMATTGGEAAVSGATGAPGETVKLTLSLADFPQADQISVKLEYDASLEWVKEESSWLISGELTDVDKFNKNICAWTDKNPVDVNKQLLELAFVMPEPAVGQTNFNYSVKCTVTVMANGTVLGAVEATGYATVQLKATSVQLNQTALALDLNGTKTQTLTATVLPANCTQSASWTSDNAEVATVSNGVVTAQKAGTAKITVTVGDVSAQCNVTVSCSHNWTDHPAVTPNCQRTGNNQYFTCDACNGTYKADKTTPTTVEAEQLPLGGHVGGTASCTAQAVCGTCGQGYGDLLDHDYQTTWTTDATNHYHKCKNCTAAKDTGAHSYVWVTDVPATQLTEGSEHEECETCKYKTGDTRVIPHTHKVTHHVAVAATCKKTGNVEYWTCESTLCSGKYYNSEACTQTVADIVTAINPDNHKNTELRNVKAANCYQGGYTGDTWCTDCVKELSKGQATDPTGNHVGGSAWQKNDTHHWHICTTTGCGAEVGKAAHSYQWKLDKAATEDETGLKHEECVCGVKRNEGTVIPKLDHVHVGITHHAAVKATCIKAGTVEYWTCSSKKCDGKYYSDKACQLVLESIIEAINKDNHTGGTEVKDAVQATCSESGYSGDTYCLSCKAMITKGAVVPATGKHTPKAGYEMDAEKHWQLCSHCGAVVNNAKEGHTYKWVVDQKATESKTGTKHQECTVCGHKTAEGTVVDKLKHAPKLVEGKAPTCTEAGSLEHFYCASCGRYYAAVEGKAGDQIEKSAVELPATGHSFSEQWQSDEKGHFHVCACGEIADQAEHTAEVINAKEATDTEPGYTGDTVCSVCGYEVSKGQEIPVGETIAPTEESQQPTEGQPQDDEKDKKVGFTAALGIAPVIVAIAIGVVLFVKKRKV